MDELWSNLDAWDQRTFLQWNHWMHAVRGTELRELLRLGSTLGGAWGAALVLLCILFLARPLRRRLLWACDTLVVYLVVGLAVDPIKRWFDRPRPYATLADAFAADGRAHLGFGEHGRYYAFPSGHTALIFALATLLTFWALEAGGRGRAILVALVGLVWCGITMLSRIYAGQHYPLDLLGGAVLGLGLTILLLWIRVRGARWRSRRQQAVLRPPTADPAPHGGA